MLFFFCFVGSKYGAYPDPLKNPKHGAATWLLLLINVVLGSTFAGSMFNDVFCKEQNIQNLRAHGSLVLDIRL